MKLRAIAIMVLLASALVGCGGGEPADGGGLDYVLDLAGKTPAESGLLDTEPLHNRLTELLGRRYEALAECMEEAGPLAEVDGAALALCSFTHRDGATGAALMIDPALDRINVRFKVNRVVQEFNEESETLVMPPEVDALFEEVESAFWSVDREERRAAAPAATSPAPAPAPAENEPPPPPPGGVYRGFLVIGEDLATFMTCETYQTAWVKNASGQDLEEIHRSLEAKPYAPVYAEARGNISQAPPEIVKEGYDLLLELLELRRAYPTGEGPDCDESLAFVFRAFGNEPSWGARVTTRALEFTRLGEPAALQFPAAEPIFGPGETRYVSSEGENRIEILISAERCRDSMSGALFHLGARIRLDGKTYKGCAMRGKE